MTFLNHLTKAVSATFVVLLLITAATAQRRHPAEGSRSARSNFETGILVKNDSRETVKLFALDQNGERKFLKNLEPNGESQVSLYLLEPLLVTDKNENAAGLYYPDAQPRTVRISGSVIEDAGRAGNGNTGSNSRGRDEDYDDYDDDGYDDYYERRGAKYDTNPITICSNQEVPRGFVIVSASSEWNCPNWSATGKNAYTIKRPSLSESTTICSNQKIPRGFVATGASNEWNCPNWSATGKNAYAIKRLGRNETATMCSVQSVPRGFVVTGASSEWNCPNWSATAKNAYTVRRPRDEEEVCSVSDVPRGYVVTSESSKWECPNWSATGKNSRRIKRIR